MAKGKSKPKTTTLSKIQDVRMDKISVFFRRPTLKSIVKILTMEHGGFRTYKSVKNINKLFANIDMSKYKGNPELESYIWCISYFSKQWLDGIVTPGTIAQMAESQPDFDNIKRDIISTCMNDPNIISAPESKALFDLIGESLQFGYVASLKDEYITLLDDINMDEPGAFKELVGRLFLVSQSLLDIKHNTNLIANKITFNTSDMDSVRQSLGQTIDSLKESSNILKTGITRLNTLLSPGYMNGRLYVYLGLPGGGKAQPDDTMIPTPNGFKRLDKLEVGDLVFNLYGKPVRVTDIFPQEIQDTYEVTFSDGRHTRCNIDHLWRVTVRSHGKFVPKVMTLGEIMEDYQYTAPGSPDKIHHRYMVENNGIAQFNEQEISVNPWLLGYIIGNGCCLENTFKVSCPDDWAPMKIAKLLKLYPQRDNDKNYSYIFREGWDVNSRIKTEDVIGDIPEIFQKYSHEKRIPKNYLFNTEYIRMELLRGLMDSDGSIYEAEDSGYEVSYSTVSSGLVEDVSTLLGSLGIGFSVKTRIQDNKRDQYTIILKLPNRDLIKLFTYPKKLNIALRAKDKAQRRNYNYIRITDIKKVEKTSQRCILIDDPLHVYLTEQFIPTHNSMMLLKSALDIRKYNPNFKSKTPGMKPAVLYITMENSFTESIERVWNMNFDDPITMYGEDQAVEMLCKELGISQVLREDVKVVDTDSGSELDALLVDDSHDDERNIEIVMKYFSYREISTDDLYTIIQDLHDENLEVIALVFDYIKRIEPATPAADNVKLELNRIINELKALSVILDIPVITAHQMNRSAAATIDAATRQGKGDVTKLAGRENVGDAWEVLETADWAAALNIETKPGTDDRYICVNLLKRRRVESAESEMAKYTYLAHPFARNNGLRLLDDYKSDKILSLKSLSSDIDIVGKEKENAVPRLKTLDRKSFVEDDDII